LKNIAYRFAVKAKGGAIEMFLGCPDAFTAKARASQFKATRMNRGSETGSRVRLNEPDFRLPIIGAIIQFPLFP
jgi:hypothetical protein